MLLKATIKCSCGCSYEMDSYKEHESVKCPNCLKDFSQSEKLIDILKTFNSIDLTKDDDNNTDLFNSIFHKESLSLHTIDENNLNEYHPNE